MRWYNLKIGKDIHTWTRETEWYHRRNLRMICTVELKEFQNNHRQCSLPKRSHQKKKNKKPVNYSILRPSFDNNTNAMTDEWCIDHKGNEVGKRIQKSRRCDLANDNNRTTHIPNSPDSPIISPLGSHFGLQPLCSWVLTQGGSWGISHPPQSGFTNICPPVPYVEVRRDLSTDPENIFHK